MGRLGAMPRARLLAAVASLACVAGLVGCDSEPDAFAVRFTNDLSLPVVLALCHSDRSAKCEHPYYRDHIKSGDATEENISPDIRTEWAIESDEGRPTSVTLDFKACGCPVASACSCRLEAGRRTSHPQLVRHCR